MSSESPKTQIAALVRVLGQDSEPVNATRLADKLGIEGKDNESRKRTVRAIVRLAREDKDEGGYRICANLAGGYWLARSEREWTDYEEARRRKATFEFVHVRRMQEAAIDAGNKQGRLFADKDAGVMTGVGA